MEEHPDSQPCSAETVDRGNDDDGYGNQQFESKWIDDLTSLFEYEEGC